MLHSEMNVLQRKAMWCYVTFSNEVAFMTIYHVCFIFIYFKDKAKGKGIFKKSSAVRAILTPSSEAAQVLYPCLGIRPLVVLCGA